jgi:hypothetical protein
MHDLLLSRDQRLERHRQVPPIDCENVVIVRQVCEPVAGGATQKAEQGIIHECAVPEHVKIEESTLIAPGDMNKAPPVHISPRA